LDLKNITTPETNKLFLSKGNHRRNFVELISHCKIVDETEVRTATKKQEYLMFALYC